MTAGVVGAEKVLVSDKLLWWWIERRERGWVMGGLEVEQLTQGYREDMAGYDEVYQDDDISCGREVMWEISLYLKVYSEWEESSKEEEHYNI